jgi:hypothetical protein
MIIDVTHPAITFDPADRTFVAELSSLEQTRFEITNLCFEGAPIYVKNPRTGGQVKMTRFKVDSSDSGEDIAGWWYRGKTPVIAEFKFLFIND